MFWDRENDFLFAAVAAGRGLDYASTLNLRHRGIDEAFLTNAIVDNHPLFAGIEMAATAVSVGVSYVFHRTGHHRLERWTSAIHAGIAVGGAIRNYNLKSPNPDENATFPGAFHCACALGAGCIILRAPRPRFFSGAVSSGEAK